VVQIELEDLFLGETGLDAQGEAGLRRLPAPGRVVQDLVGEDVPGQLHGDGAGPLHRLPRADVAGEGPEDGPGIHAAVLPKAAILHGHVRIPEDLRNLVGLQHDSAPAREVARQPPVPIEDVGRLRGAVLGDLSQRRARRLSGARRRHVPVRRDPQDQEDGERDEDGRPTGRELLPDPGSKLGPELPRGGPQPRLVVVAVPRRGIVRWLVHASL